MKAYVIKTENGYLGHSGSRHPLNEAFLYLTKKKAEEDWCEGDKIVPVEIKELPH